LQTCGVIVIFQTNILINPVYFSCFAQIFWNGMAVATISANVYRFYPIHLNNRQTVKMNFMKSWKRFIPLALVILLFLVESCHRGYGCPGTDL
jgi:hypothetical protein